MEPGGFRSVRGGVLVWAVEGMEGMGEVRTFRLLVLLRLGGLRS